MAEVNPPAHLQGATESSDVFRRVIRTLRSQQGIRQLTDLAVTQTTVASMSVNVAAGEAVIDGTQNSIYQGSYHVLNDATVNLPIAASDPTNPRIDLVVARVYDQQYSGSTSSWALEVETGTPAITPAVPATPNNSLPLAQILVNATAVAIGNGVITDLRVPGTGQMITVLGRTQLSAAAASITFSGIPQYYKNLLIMMQGGTSNAARQNLVCQINGDTAAHYRMAQVYTLGGASANAATQTAASSAVVGQVSTVGTDSGAVLFMPNYSSDLGYQEMMNLAGVDDTGGSHDVFATSAAWTATAPVTSLKFFPGAGNFITGTIIVLYGLP